jgi:hypothetical protein
MLRSMKHTSCCAYAACMLCSMQLICCLMLRAPLQRPHAASGWRIHCGAEVTELSTNKQHTLSHAELITHQPCYTVCIAHCAACNVHASRMHTLYSDVVLGCGCATSCMMIMSFICSCRNKIGAKLNIYLEEGTYHKRLFRGPSTNDMKK